MRIGIEPQRGERNKLRLWVQNPAFLPSTGLDDDRPPCADFINELLN
jgi:hypothetical protein